MIGYLLLFVLISKVAADDCLSGTLEWNSYCYSFLSNITEFGNAEIICKNSGGHLASIHDGFKNAVLAQQASQKFHGSQETDFWIGATNLINPPTWNWTDGSSFYYNEWKKGEPQNISYSNCAALSLSDGCWTAQDCFKSKPFVCAISATPSYPITANCSNGWTYLPASHSCYGNTATGLIANWSYAENSCEDYDAHLPSIHSSAEFNYLQSYVREGNAGIWTGIYSVDSGRTWKSSDNTVADFLDHGNWCPDSPKNVSGERCVELNLSCYFNVDCTPLQFIHYAKKHCLFNF